MTVFLRRTFLPDVDHFIRQFDSDSTFFLNRVMQQYQVMRLDLRLIETLRFNVTGDDKR
ncbi:hypothetical protein D3C87_1769170 [compost metagenome]